MPDLPEPGGSAPALRSIGHELFQLTPAQAGLMVMVIYPGLDADSSCSKRKMGSRGVTSVE